MATITPRKRAGGVRYTAQIRIKRGGRVVYTESETFAKKGLARAWADQREAELKAPGELKRVQHRGLTVGQVLEWYLGDYDGLTKFGRSKLSHIQMMLNRPSLVELDALELTAADIVRHVRERRGEGTGPSTVENDLIWLRNAFRSARIGRDVPVSVEPIDDAVFLCRREKLIERSQRRERRPSVDEMTRLMEWFDPDIPTRSHIPMQDFLLFAMFSSRRASEVTGIRWSDLDERRGRVLVRKMKHPRMKTDTWVDVPARALAIIQRQPRPAGEDLIFPYNLKSVSAAMRRGCKMLGIDDLRLHDLRHECISCLFELGLDIPRVAQVSGHRSWATLQRYTHLQGGEVFDKWAGWKWAPAD